MKWFELFMPMVLLVSLLTPTAYAAININIDVSGIVNAVNGNTQSNANAMNQTKDTLNNSILGLPIDIFGLFTSSVKNSLTSFNSNLLGLTKELLSVNPDPDLMFGWWQAIVTVISAFYLLLFLVIGFSFLVSGNSSVKREQSKEWLKNAVIMIIGVSTSFYLYGLILGLSTGITRFLWESSFEQFFEPTIFSGLGIFLLLVYILTISLALITLFLRYLFLLMGVLLFPMGIFLFLTPKFENWGKMIFNFLGVMLAIQFVDIIVLIGVEQALIQLTGNTGLDLVLPLGFVIIAITNVAMMAYSIIKSAFSITNNAPILATAVNTLAGNISGAISSVKKTGATA